ncbi:hypothetical protein RUESEDTHA_00292 [Ruegeria sp. THAF57]|uniref:TadE/TadG family type IV pilus assembly protein n=1 Tax=Ruegeria sp. THAF57 TaxID=2744555 RepID=UPI0015DEFBA7|nr:hypothetical protein [Ruegeria sp. THAF57]CAD0183426.1 hypothetical protein RUESEDTHA_00292 [Ruegeria sp. THAF57]
MSFLTKFKKFFSRTARDESGLLTVEAVLIFPMLVWTVTGAFTFFDGFRQSAANLKAAYTIGDLISRETQTITDTYVDSLYELMLRMVNNGSEMKLRVTLIVFDEVDDRHYVRWSTERGYNQIWTDGNIKNMRESLPPMPNQDTLIIVETANNYVPVFGSGWVSDDYTFRNFVFTRPRFTNEIAADV